LNIWYIRRTFLNLRRLRQIVGVLAKHGFSHFIEKLRIPERLPWLDRFAADAGRKDAGRDIPERLALAFEELGPVYVKLGQLLAARPDLVPPEFMAAFGRLRDRVPPLPGAEIIPILEKSFGRPLRDLFRSFTPDARAAGSIGQVHAAELLDGSPVIVKIKRPGIGRVIGDDISLMEALADLADRRLPELAAVRPKMLIGELRRALRDELDFVGEAARAGKFADSARGSPGIAVPGVHWDFVTSDVLVMDREEGTPLSDIGALSAGERRRAAATLADCFLRQYFETGVFHADPHAGNFLYRPDGMIAIVDFGLTGRLSEDMRLVLGQMLLALRRGDIDALADLAADIGEFFPDAGVNNFRFDLGNFLERHLGVPSAHLDFAAMSMEALDLARKNGLCLPRDFVLLVKSLMSVAGLIRELDSAFRLDEAIRRAAGRPGLGLPGPGSAARRGLRLASRFGSLLRRLPDDIRDMLEKARNGRLTFIFRHDNLQASVERTGRSMDRLTLGIIAAAIIIGSSIVMSAGQGASAAGRVIPLFGGIPLPEALASFGFLLALLLAIYVAWGIFRDRK
jgi:ubiquinone biosynthesis protein